jgi:hypothetical protein
VLQWRGYSYRTNIIHYSEVRWHILRKLSYVTLHGLNAASAKVKSQYQVYWVSQNNALFAHAHIYFIWKISLFLFSSLSPFSYFQAYFPYISLPPSQYHFSFSLFARPVVMSLPPAPHLTTAPGTWRYPVSANILILHTRQRTQTMYHWVVGQLGNYLEYEIVTSLRHFPGICLERLRKIKHTSLWIVNFFKFSWILRRGILLTTCEQKGEVRDT